MPAQLATPAALAGHPLVRRAETLAAELLVPQAQHVDMSSLPMSHVDAVRQAGLIGFAGLDGEAGARPAPATFRAVTEALSGACGTTWSALGQCPPRAAYRLVDEVPAGDRSAERLDLRAAATELATRAGAALVVAQAGGAMLRTSPAQRWAREAMFHQVQAQTAAVRAAQIRRYADVSRPRGGS